MSGGGYADADNEVEEDVDDTGEDVSLLDKEVSSGYPLDLYETSTQPLSSIFRNDTLGLADLGGNESSDAVVFRLAP